MFPDHAIDFNNGICNLVASSTLPYASQGTVSNQACVDPANACTGTYQFNQYQNYALIGYARQAITTTTIDQCYSECLNAVTLYGFNCTSGMWFDPTDCILNYDNQFTQASSFAYDPTNGDYYFDKICTPDCLTTTTASTIAPTTTTASTTAPTTTTASTTASTTSQCCQIGGFWSDWENSGTCNDTCGSCGQILRTRTCLSSTWCPCSGPSTRLDNCNIAPCAYPRLSCCTPYKAISVNNSIICGPQPTPFEPKPIVTGCMPDCCPAQGVWSQWSDPIGCSDTCGACGLATQQRYCMTSGNGCPCNGNDIQSVPCNLTPCKYPRNSCCIGKIVVMNESMICTVPTSTESPASLDCASSCCPSGGAWSAWSTSQTCSDTCGSCGQLKYTRTCTSEPTCPCNGESSKSVNCNFTPCKFPRTSCCGSYKAMVVDGVIICGPQYLNIPGNNCFNFSGNNIFDSANNFNKHTNDSNFNKHTNDNNFNKHTNDNRFNKHTNDNNFNKHTHFNKYTNDNNCNKHTNGNNFNKHTNGNNFNKHTNDNRFNKHTNDNRFNKHTNDNNFNKHTNDNNCNKHTNDNRFNKHTNDNNFNKHTHFNKYTNDNNCNKHTNGNNFNKHTNDNNCNKHTNDNRFNKHTNDNNFNKHTHFNKYTNDNNCNKHTNGNNFNKHTNGNNCNKHTNDNRFNKHINDNNFNKYSNDNNKLYLCPSSNTNHE
uniref:Apple domain-containing protein n=1 Tax=Acrobeloides nanus TaxID=290746 RepID=A0A914DZQ4_9BILA